MEQASKITFNILSDTFPNLQKNLAIYEKHCVTYLLHNSKEIYIGETSHLKARFKAHAENEKKSKLIQTKIITSDYFNKSAVFDIESKLINYMFAEDKYELLNIKTNQSPHHYYLKEQFNDVFKEIWKKLQEEKIVEKDLAAIENDPLFKYSPFKVLSEEQNEIVQKIVNGITTATLIKGFATDGSLVTKREFTKNPQKIIIKGGPGTGKTLLIIKLVHDLARQHLVDTSKVAICIPQSSLMKTLKNMTKKAKLKVKLLRPVDLSRLKAGELDLLIVDESHRLKKHFSKQAKDLKHLQGGKFNELDLARDKSRNLILMYDSKQTVRPADIEASDVNKLTTFTTFSLNQQFRVKAGFDYIQFIEALLQISQTMPSVEEIGSYDIKIFDSLPELEKAIMNKEAQFELCRMASGYYKEWISKNDPKKFDFESEGLKRKWNTTITGWAHTLEAKNEVGCIHTLQGEDLNYAGVIIGDEIYMDPTDQKIKIRKEKYFDRNGTPVIGTDKNNELLTSQIKNIYYVLLTRGILGTYIYIKDPILNKHFKEILSSKK